MPGTLNVGGHDIITHSGTAGAGTVNLVDQAGNTILTDSGSGMSISSNVAFPAGHVIQVVQDSWQGKTSSLSSSSVWTATGLEKDIQISSGNYVLVECVLAVEVITSGTNGLVALASGANNTLVDSNDFIINPWMINGLAIADNVTTAGRYLHTTPQSTVPQRYKVFVKPEANFTIQYGAETGAGYFYNTLTLYEIQA
jgi:hypothetical protein